MGQRLEHQGIRHLDYEGKGLGCGSINLPATAFGGQTPFPDVLYIHSLNPQNNPMRETYNVIPNPQMRKLRPRRGNEFCKVTWLPSPEDLASGQESPKLWVGYSEF